MLSNFNKKNLAIPNDYSINLMWINKTTNPEKPYICPYTREDEIKKIQNDLTNEIAALENEVLKDIKKAFDDQKSTLSNKTTQLYETYIQNQKAMGSNNPETQLSLQAYMDHVKEESIQTKELTEQFESEKEKLLQQKELQAAIKKAEMISEKKQSEATDESAVMTLFLSKAIKWQEANPNAEVTIWYDALTVTDEQIKATQALLKKALTGVKLQNIRDIDSVKNNPDCFSSNIPIYVRVDVLKLIICIESLETLKKEAVIFTDIDVGELRNDKSRMKKEELFSFEVMEKLKKIGVLLGEDTSKIENQFFQALNTPNAIQGLKLIVDANLNRLTTMLNAFEATKNIYVLDSLGSNFHFVGIKQQLPPLLCHLYDKEKYPIKINPNVLDDEKTDEWIDFDPDVYGCLPLGNMYFKRADAYIVCPNSFDLSKARSLHESIQLPKAEARQMSRGKVDVRDGGSHPIRETEMELLKTNKPADGLHYKCQLYIQPTKTLEPKDNFKKRPT